MKIIYIDDDAMNRAVLVDMFATAGVVVDSAGDAESGLAMIEETLYDLVLMDLRMPGVSGLTAIRQLRAREKNDRRVPIVVVSAELSEGARELCRGAGADDFIEKPLTLDGLFDVAGAALSSKALLI